MNIGPILVIDDDLSFRQLVAQLLASRGYTVVHAVSAAEADEVMKENPPSMAIVDYRLPGRDGISWISSLRDSGSSLPVVFLSGTRCDQKMFNKLRSILRVALILQKPIVPELFLEQIDMVLPAPGKRTHEELTIPPAAILEEPVAAQGGEELHKQAAAPDVVRYIMDLRRQAQAGARINAPALMFWVISVFYFAPFAVLNYNETTAYVVPGTMHWMQYLALNYMLVRWKYIDERAKDRSHDLSPTAVLALFFALALSLFAISVGLWQLKLTDTIHERIFIGILVGLSNVHYFQDAFLWRFREAFQRDNVLKYIMQARAAAN